MEISRSKDRIIAISESLTAALNTSTTTVVSCRSGAAECLKITKEILRRDLSLYSRIDAEELENKYTMLVNYGKLEFEDKEEEMTYSRYCTIQILHYNDTLLEVLNEISN